MKKKNFLIIALIIISGFLIWFSANAFGQIRFRKCPEFHLRTDKGKIINPLNGKNADKPYSTRQTCGASGCHDYDKITKGFHFQQGWENIKDSFSMEKPWVLSPGMMGKM